MEFFLWIRPRKSSLHFPTEDDDAVDEVIPYGNEEVEIAKINLKEKEWEQKLLLVDIQILSHYSGNMEDTHVEKEGDSWMISSRKSILVSIYVRNNVCFFEWMNNVYLDFQTK